MNMLLRDVGVVSLDVPGTLMQPGRREGVRGGRKQGGELEWAAVPVLRRRRLNFKHTDYCSTTLRWAKN